MLALIAGTISLFLFILLLGDVRRKQMVVAQATSYASELTARLGESRKLPINLELELPPDQQGEVRRFDFLSHSEVRALRSVDERLIVVYTRDPMHRRLLPDGYAVVLFESGVFDSAWLSVGQFNRLIESQRHHYAGTGE